ncbi:MAG: O-antigen ligase family protein [Bacteroidales bacterium]|nr:O-antigen ligase family protein [Bacteroidales bacterium]
MTESTSGLRNGKTNQLWDKAIVKLAILILVAIYVYLLKDAEMSTGVLLAGGPIAILFVSFLFSNPRFAFITLFYYNYFAMGITRYFPAPLGLGIDGLLVLTYVALLFKSYKNDVGFSRMINDLSLVALIWYLYALFELLNPIVESRIAWVYAMRGFSLYFFLTIPVTFVIFNKYRDLNMIIRLWSIFSILGVLKGLQQLYIGMDFAEQRWLDTGGALTHIIWSGLRVFSFYTDAGQFGATMGHSGVVFFIVALGKKEMRSKLYYGIVALLCFYGMSISGTRGAMAVPAAGFMLFIILSKNWKLMTVGLFLLMLMFIFFKFTSIGNGNDQIRRMRSSFDTNDASLQTRLVNQERLKTYMANKPFGCGIGTTGSFGQQYTPYLLSAQIPTDSWFVAIWVEQGEVGLMLHISILVYCLLRGIWIVFFRIKDRELSFKITALLCGYIGIIGASYGNTVLGQLPTSLITYMSLSFIFMAPLFQREIDEENARKELLIQD